MKTFKALLKIEYLLMLRSLSVLFLSIGMPVFFFLFYSTFATESKNILKIMMFNMSAFSSISFALFVLPFSLQEDRRNNRLNSLRYSSVPLWQYYTAKIIKVIFYDLLSCLLVFSLGHFVRGITMSALDWVTTGLLLMFGALMFISLGLLLAYIQSSETLSILSNILYIGLAIMGGLWMPVSIFPEWLQVISKVTPTYHFANLFYHYLSHGIISLSSVVYLISFFLVCLLGVYLVAQLLEAK
ncbi:TPA: ABC transporter permease [Streptococcus equi subsp. zooepidemicus]|nr:ABC transporter permease [Streptococcus equi subsp. zooepidemicus]HEL0687612.1 ABC transporter permease [Streptococcus equi subsp. zooepidemicus]HEL0750711.1 ABC transporter permease [Streptococcus equi subsp. zooepidemicus]HEL0773262.1 ABC transporter permease [Streptococcus equi subsp. zooepidemicus]HEL1042673.1 ABC transporter permease [Streptococcus equi subsp. zooepidemicus]